MFPPNYKMMGLLRPEDLPINSNYEANKALGNQTNTIMADAARIGSPAPIIIPPSISPMSGGNLANPILSPMESKIQGSMINTPLPNMPQREDYQLGIARKILGYLGGALGGANGHPEIGRGIVDAPYNKAMGDYQSKLATMSPVAGMEEKARTAGIAEDKVNSSIGLHNAQMQQTADKLNMQGEFNRDKMAQQDVQFKDKEARLTKAAQDRANRLLSPEIKQKIFEDLTSKLKKGEIDQATYDADLQFIGGGEQLGKFERKKQIEVQYAGPKAEQSASGRIAGETSDISRTGQQKLAEAKSTGSTQGKISTETQQGNVEAEANRAKIMEEVKAEAKRNFEKKDVDSLIPQINAAPYENRAKIISVLPVNIKAALYRDPRIDTKTLVTDPKDAEYIKNARVSLNHIDNLRGLLKDPFIQANIGAIAGRINTAGQKIGSDFVFQHSGKSVAQNTADAAKEQNFLTSAMQLLAWEAKNIAGTRPAASLFDKLKNTSPGAFKGIGQNEGALNALETSANMNIDGRLGITHTGNKSTEKPKSILDNIKWGK